VERFPEAAEQKFQLHRGQCRRRAAAEKNCRWKEMSILRLLPELAQKRFTKSLRLRTIQQLFIKRAVRANPRTEGNVNVDMADCVAKAGRNVMHGTTHRFA